MARLTVGGLIARTGVTRKALRVYEAAGILTPLSRTPSGYRVYGGEAVQIVAFIAQARRLGFSVAEIRQIVGLRQAGRAPCVHVQRLAREKIATLDGMLRDLKAMRRRLGLLVAARRTSAGRVVCPHIEAFATTGRNRHGREDVAVPVVHTLPRSRDHRRRSADR